MSASNQLARVHTLLFPIGFSVMGGAAVGRVIPIGLLLEGGHKVLSQKEVG